MKRAASASNASRKQARPANSFSVLVTDCHTSDSSSDEDTPESDCSKAPSSTSIVSTGTTSTAAGQAGGSVALRADNMVSDLDVQCTKEEIAACVKVIDLLGTNTALFKLPQFRSLRAALHPLIIEQMKTNYESTGKAMKEAAAGRKRKMDTDPDSKLANMEKEYINQTQLRAVRLRQLEALNQDDDAAGAAGLMRVPDGVALTDQSQQQLLLLSDGTPLEQTSVPQEEVELRNPLSCYICHKPYRKLHFFYDKLCPECAAFNYMKRDEMCDMNGKVCIVTGARQKIGYRCALKLLRCGAAVIATTRFPHDAAKKFAEEVDHEKWMHRLHVYGLDFRDLGSLEAFCAFVIVHYPRLDVIINNACQTVRRPPAYYAHLINSEQMLLDFAQSHGKNVQFKIGFQENVDSSETTASQPSNTPVSSVLSTLSPSTGIQHMLGPQVAFMNELHRFQGDSTTSTQPKTDYQSTNAEDSFTSPSTLAAAPTQPTAASVSSALLTQVQLTAGDEAVPSAAPGAQFPAGRTDVNGQQVDMRSHNSWTMRLHEVSTPELAEVFTINAIAPAIINARLKKLMERNIADMKFIVNVSAMEGKFYRFKNETHPHTNMAKASLNMMTRTSAQDYVKSRIYMTAVDTGWINDEKPLPQAQQHFQKHNFQTPIDEQDAASRVLDPVIAPLLALQRGEPVEPPWGHFLKDYQKCEW